MYSSHFRTLLLHPTTPSLHAGSFVGMSLPSRLVHGRRRSDDPISLPLLVSAYATAGALGGIVHGITIDLGFWPGGWGGKAGSCAFVGES